MRRGDARDPALPFLEVVLTPNRMEHFLNERVLPSLFPGKTATRVRRRGLRYEPGSRAVALYSLRSSSNGRALPERAVVSTFAEPGLARLPLERYAEDADAQALFLADENVLVEFFPQDWRLPGLPAAADPDGVRQILSRVSGSAAQGWRCTVAQYRPNERCVLVYEEAEGPRKVVAKLYANARRAAHAHSVLESLARVRGGAAAWRTPYPLALSDEHAAVWMEHAEGVSLRNLLPTGGDRGDDDALQVAAHGLAELHAASGQRIEAPERTLASERARIRRAARHVPTLDREVARGLDWFLDALERGAPQASSSPAAVLHGSTRPHQLWLAGDRLTLLDVDAVAQGDPALDVGSFLAALVEAQLESPRPEPLVRAGERFVEAYLKHIPHDPDFEGRARHAAAQELVGQAARSFIQRGGERDVPSDATRCHLLLEQASKLLGAA